jgi:archaellum component FlaC
MLLNQKEYYEGRIADLKSGHSEISTDLRTTRETTSQALQGAIHNTTRLISQVDELQELTRVATPVLIARAAVENANDST